MGKTDSTASMLSGVANQYLQVGVGEAFYVNIIPNF